MNKLVIEYDPDGAFPLRVSDGYHTFDELYEHRCLLWIALTNLHPVRSFKSYCHSDGSSYDGWFILGMTGPKQMTYHIPNRFWELSLARGVDKAPEWDGHTPDDVINRLKDLIQEQRDAFSET